jgi:hypothetical protein
MGVSGRVQPDRTKGQSFYWPLLLAAIATWCCCGPTMADEPVPPPEDVLKERAAEAFRLVTEEADKYELYLGVGRNRKLEIHPKSILRWTNPVSGSLYGEVFIWTADGRPEAIASIFKWYTPHTHLSVEWQSLSTERITAYEGQRPVWFPGEVGVELKPILGADRPADTPTARLTQMRNLARQFSARAFDRYDPDEVQELRLLAQPIYRYETTRPDLLDGALFTFAEGTNPEIILMIEARRTANGPQWKYAMGRQNSIALEALHEGRVVWSVPRLAPPWDRVRDPRKPYILLRRDFATESSGENDE